MPPSKADYATKADLADLRKTVSALALRVAALEAAPVPAPTPTPTPTPTPAPTPAPTPTPEPQPAPDPAPDPAPEPQPVPTPDPAPQPEPVPDPVPDPPAPIPDPTPVPDPIPISTPQPTPGPLTAALAFIDGSSLVTSEDQAVDVGTVDTGLAQVNRRMFVPPNDGSYHSAFTLMFDTDQRGKKSVTVEYGTRYQFPAGKLPAVDGGIAPQHLFLPPLAKLSKIPGNTTQQIGIVSIAMSYVGPGGESLASRSDSAGYIALAAGDLPVVKSPPPFGDMTDYMVYATFGGSGYHLQTATPVPLGTDWSCPSTGVVLSGKLAPSHPARPAYTLSISGGPLAAPVVIPVEFHPWRTRFRVQLGEPLPVQRTFQQLVDSKALLSMNLKYVPGLPLPAPAVKKGPLSLAGIINTMNAPSERGEIGMVTAQQTAYLATEKAEYLAGMMAQADVAGAVPFWVRDAGKPGCPLVLPSTHPFLAFLDANFGPHTIPTPAAAPLSYDSLVIPDEAHMPALSYVPYLLTGDPWHLEGMQAVALYGILEANNGRLNSNKDSAGKVVTTTLVNLANTLAPRGLAWNWRDIFRCVSYVPDVVPSWLLPKQAFRDILVDQKTYGQRFLDNKSTPLTTVFCFFNMTSQSTAFHLDYLCHVIAENKRRGDVPEMQPIFDYIVTPKLAMSGRPVQDGSFRNASGWDARYPMVYYEGIIDARKKDKATGLPTTYWSVGPNPDAPESFGEWFDCIEALNKVKNPATWPDSTKLGDRVASWQSGYYTLVRSTLAALSQAGYDTKEAHDWLYDQLFVKKWPNVNVWLYTEWCFAPA